MHAETQGTVLLSRLVDPLYKTNIINLLAFCAGEPEPTCII